MKIEITPKDQAAAAAFAMQQTAEIFTAYQAKELITAGGKRAMISRTTLAESIATGFLVGRAAGKIREQQLVDALKALVNANGATAEQAFATAQKLIANA